MGCNNEKNQNNLEIPKSEQSVNRLLHQISVLFDKKYKLQTCATIVSMPGGEVRLLGFHSHIKGPLSREHIRKILINSAQDFLDFVNSNDSIKPYLKNYPFEIKNIEIIIIITNSKGIGLDDPYIGIAEIFREKIVYQNLITTDIPSIKSEFEESYEEALKICKGPDKTL